MMLSFDKLIDYVDIEPGQRVIIVGDIHGQLETTLTIFEDYGYPSIENIYIFNGDIVDRGEKSVECLLMLLAFKVALPLHFLITRGNHETLTVGLGSFYRECLQKLPDYSSVFDDFHSVFDTMPYGYVVHKKVFVAHAGLTPGIDLTVLSDLPRHEFNHDNLPHFHAMIWNDPCEDGYPTLAKSGLAPSPRGKNCHLFSAKVTRQFLHRHGLELFVRSHEAVQDGFNSCQGGFCMTIFSAPNYGGRGNGGAVFIVNYNGNEIQPMRNHPAFLNAAQ